jgi:hypothetical protein
MKAALRKKGYTTEHELGEVLDDDDADEHQLQPEIALWTDGSGSDGENEQENPKRRVEEPMEASDGELTVNIHDLRANKGILGHK